MSTANNRRTKQSGGNHAIQVAGSVQHGGILNAGGVAIHINVQQAPPPTPPGHHLSAPEVLQLLEHMRREQRGAVMEFAAMNLGLELLQGLKRNDLYRIQRYAEAVIKKG